MQGYRPNKRIILDRYFSAAPVVNSAADYFQGLIVTLEEKYMIAPAFLPAVSKTGYFWPIWLSNMRKAVTSQSLPWQQH